MVISVSASRRSARESADSVSTAAEVGSKCAKWRPAAPEPRCEQRKILEVGDGVATNTNLEDEADVAGMAAGDGSYHAFEGSGAAPAVVGLTGRVRRD